MLDAWGGACGALQQGGGGDAFVISGAVADVEGITPGEALAGGHAGANAGTEGGASDLDDAGGLLVFIHDGHGLAAQGGFVAQGGLEVEGRDVDGGEHGGEL